MSAVSLEAIVENAELTLPPRYFAPDKTMSAIPTARTAYSIDDTPFSSLQSLRHNLDI
jgi:hypothetical protein